ncbi:MupG family TIM beta-alpha barrel fold protein [Hydrogenoanaerobacterium sp.]|uniref:MupG family TIM beta-alpha barrel fold protein n=1 Tax=Hydrogenoanaerobacterium sp. TaxID=2953763 RepID=UPI0028A17FD8|nr:MupG family TIM beta-alpha barrel fold protein [Hydrogenoanaerobacterium sp.]
MLNGLGFSVYLSLFEAQKEHLQKLYRKGSYVFTSFHISEELDETYPARAKEMCRWLSAAGFRVVADVSKKTLGFFGTNDIIGFAREMGIEILRIDYGFTDDEIVALAMQMPIAVNASTLGDALAERLATAKNSIYAMHNFYPRPETGLDEAFFRRCNERLHRVGIKVLAFIPGDTALRGPIFEGLPTLECHRGQPPYVSYLDLVQNYQIDGVFVGDGRVSEAQLAMIDRYCTTGVCPIPACLETGGEGLYGRTFTVRADSPACTMRFQESREYSCFGRAITPQNCVERTAGCITVDNIGYSRYSGEIQLVRTPLPADERVNVIGRVHECYLALTESVPNGGKLVLIPADLKMPATLKD